MNDQLTEILDHLDHIHLRLIEDAKGASTIDDIRAIALDLSDRLLSEIHDLATENEIPISRVIRNFLAETSPGNLYRLCCFLRIWCKDSSNDFANEIKAALAQASKQAKDRDFFCWLLSGGRGPNLKDLLVFFGKNVTLALMVCREIYAGKLDESFTVKLLRSVHRGCWGIAYNRKYRSDFLSEGFGKGLPKLSESSFNRLPGMVRKWLLSDWAFAKESLQADFFTNIKADPYSFKDTPDSIWIKKELPLILDQLRNRNSDILITDRFKEVLEREDVENYADQILKAFRSRPRFIYYDYFPFRLDLPVKKICLFSNQRLARTLLFFTHDVDKRIEKLPKMSGEELQELIEDVSPYDFAEAIFECKSSIHLKRIKDEALKNTILKGLIFDLLERKSIFSELFKIFIRDLYKDSSAEKILSLCSFKPVAFTYWEPGDLNRPFLLNVMHKVVARPSLFVCFVNNVSDTVLNKLSVSQDEGYRNLRIELCSRACKSTNKDFRFSYITCLLSNESELIESLENWKIFNEEFDFLIKQSISSKSPELIKAVLSLVDRKGVPCWHGFIKKGKLVRRISRAIRKYRPDLYHSLQNVVAQRLLKNTKFKKKLQSVLSGKAHAQTLGVSQSVLRHFVPWARKKWAKKPTVAVAYELALTFSIKDSRYLLYLCTERWCSNNRFDGGKVFDHLYTTYDLPKKSGGKRTVTVPDDRLKRLQRRLLWNGFEKHEIHTASHGFVRGRSILTNAKEHLGQPLVVNIDIESFFPNTRYSHILKACSKLVDGELSEGARRIVADLCSYNGALPTGAPTSPAISNIVLKSVDEAVSKAATENGIVYTRYADDLTFSGKSNTPKILPFVGRVLAQYGYRIEEKKTNLFRKGRRQIVTGLVVNEKPNLPRKIRRKLRAAIHVRSKDGTPHWHGKPMNDAELVGRVSFLNLVQPEEAQKHLDTLTNNNKSTH